MLTRGFAHFLQRTVSPRDLSPCALQLTGTALWKTDAARFFRHCLTAAWQQVPAGAEQTLLPAPVLPRPSQSPDRAGLSAPGMLQGLGPQDEAPGHLWRCWEEPEPLRGTKPVTGRMHNNILRLSQESTELTAEALTEFLSAVAMGPISL